MINYHGFNEFMDTENQNFKSTDKEGFQMSCSWSNSVIIRKQCMEMMGYQCTKYQQKVEEVFGKSIDSAVFVGKNLVTCKSNKLLMITDQLDCYQFALSHADFGEFTVENLEATERDLIIILESRLCISCTDLADKIRTSNKTDPGSGISVPGSIVCHNVAQVSCGKEHLIILDTYGTVFTCGGGSRGQLGHGTVDSSINPKMVNSLAGVKMVSVAAGGWHSLCISECGDVYVWGWNESGQLGLPSSCRTSTPAKSQQYCKPQENVTPIDVSGKTDNLVTNVSITPEDSSLDSKESLIFKQSIEPAQIHSLPCIIDLIDRFNIKMANCGTRHTVLLADDGTMLSSGWNDYGQLCQEDTETRDYFETSSIYTKKNVRVRSVCCGPWSTFVFI